MKYSGGGGGAFVKFEKVGDKYAGTVTGTREIPNNMQAGTMQTVVDVVKADGTKLTVALGPKALQAAWKNAVDGNGGSLVGRFVTFEFESTYKPKKGGNLGKEISVDVAEGPISAAAVATGTTTAGGDAVEAAIKTLVEKKGAEAAAQIRRAVESVEKDPAKQAAMLLKAAGA